MQEPVWLHTLGGASAPIIDVLGALYLAHAPNPSPTTKHPQQYTTRHQSRRCTFLRRLIPIPPLFSSSTFLPILWTRTCQKNNHYNKIFLYLSPLPINMTSKMRSFRLKNCSKIDAIWLNVLTVCTCGLPSVESFPYFFKSLFMFQLVIYDAWTVIERYFSLRVGWSWHHIS